jgi:Pyruvate/2-oxoacid:ferredoxin oxidoreductase gamma subunit
MFYLRNPVVKILETNIKAFEKGMEMVAAA